MYRSAYLVFALMLSLWSCKPDSDAPCRSSVINRIQLTNAQALLFPYGGKDSLWFLNASGDSIFSVVTTSSVFYNGVAIRSNPECPADSDGYFGVTRAMQDSQARMRFSYTIARIDSSFSMKVNGSSLRVRFANISNEDSSFHDSLTLGGATWYDIHAFANAQGDSFYYNTAFGLVRMRSSTEQFTLCKKR